MKQAARKPTMVSHQMAVTTEHERVKEDTDKN